MMQIAIAGNPNAGKTCVFNELTGTTQQVSNYPGVTVERKVGTTRLANRRFEVVDLPGTYSLTAYSQEEIVARRSVLHERPALVVDVVDASNLERNLYLTVQLMEMRVPLVIALNMVDVAERRGWRIDAERLSNLLGVPVVPTVACRGRGIDTLLGTCIEVVDGTRPALPHPVTYGHEVEREIETLADELGKIGPLAETRPPRWLAVKLLEEDEETIGLVREVAGEEAWTAIERQVAQAAHRIEVHCGEDPVTVLAERRYGFVAGAVRECVSRSAPARRATTDRIDAVVCSRTFGPLILVAVVAALFFWVFKLSDEWAWVPWFDGWRSPTGVMEWVFDAISTLIAPLAAPMPMLHSLLDDGIVGGVGGVMGFVPLIFLMFLFIAALEDSGYIARVAFILDRVFKAFGLQGKSILALIVSGGLGAGGCAVPGVMATRTLREEKDRLITMLVVPFMNCGAKMPVYAMLIAAFFPRGRTRMMLLLWAISWAVALTGAWVLRRFVLRGEQTPFVMELPPYHLPTLRGVLNHTWERTWMYVKKAGTLILAVNVVLWVFMYFPRLPEERVEPTATAEQRASQALAHSMAGRFGRALEPVSQAAGFDWRTNIALIGGFAAKEVVVGTLGTVYSLGDADEADFDSLTQQLRTDPHWSRLKAFALMLFVMIYAPCLATVAVIKRESGSWKWAAFSTLWSTAIAFALATAVYRIGLLLV